MINNENKSIISAFTSNVRYHILKLGPYDDLYECLNIYIKEQNIQAGSIVTCVGSLRKINIRLANSTEFIEKEGMQEIVSLVGQIGLQRSHVHISISDTTGYTMGGHLMTKGNLVYTTAEITIVEFLNISFSKSFDERTGFDELSIDKTS